MGSSKVRPTSTARIQKNTKGTSTLAEERFDRMISEVEDYAIILLSSEGLIVTWNKGAERIKGYAAEEIIGKSFKNFYTKEDNQRGLPEILLSEAGRSGKSSHEGWRVKKDGSRFWGNVAITALHDENGSITGYLKVTRDLTERKLAEDKFTIYLTELENKNEELRKSEERYHKMISEVSDYAIILLDKEGIIMDWNKGAEKLKGYLAQEIIGKSFKIFYEEKDRVSKLPDRLLDEARKNGVANHEGYRIRKDGTLFWGSITITALHDDLGDVIGFSKVTRDLTERKKAEDAMKLNAKEVQLKNQELQRLNSELISFAYVVSHDLKEPIRKIQIFAARQQEPQMPENKIRDFSEKIISTASRMQKLMEALLSYSQLSNVSPGLERVDLNNTLRDVKNDLEILISEKNIQIESINLPTIDGISFQLHQLFLNLLSNTLKFSMPGRPPKIRISAEIVSESKLPEELQMKARKYNQITFSDNGIGFEQEQVNRIFDVFQRLVPKTDTTGTGIGLAIVKKVVDNHGGLIVAEGKLNEGATFTIYLPIAD